MVLRANVLPEMRCSSSADSMQLEFLPRQKQKSLLFHQPKADQETTPHTAGRNAMLLSELEVRIAAWLLTDRRACCLVTQLAAKLASPDGRKRSCHRRRTWQVWIRTWTTTRLPTGRLIFRMSFPRWIYYNRYKHRGRMRPGNSRQAARNQASLCPFVSHGIDCFTNPRLNAED